MKNRALATALLLALTAMTGSVPALAAGGAGAEGPSQPASRLEMGMTLYAGGITMGQMGLNATLRGSEYHVVSTLQTSGVINAFWQSEIQATSTGKMGAKNFMPTLYDSFYTGRTGRKQEVSLSYEDASPKLYAEPAYSTTGFEVKPEDTRNTLDPLSAITSIFSGVAAQPGNPCAITAPVFDGRRRYNIEVTKVKEVDVRMDSGLYQGKAIQCEVRYRQIAGFRPRVLKENEKFPVIHAWFVTLPSAVAGRDYVVPVRIWADTKYGVLAVLANAVKVDGQTPKGFRS
ncbi:MAG TPA: DUF3108 domain-containing protein [Rhizomicrobium sp.]|nr:DUF3108 domain-containing protein [Rhizomicrobium sp.]